LALKFTALALFPYLCTSARRQASKFAAVISLRSTTRAQKAGKLRAFQQVIDRGFPWVTIA